MLNIIVPDKRPNTAARTLQQEATSGLLPAARGGGISPQISIYHLNHISLAAIGRKSATTDRRGEGKEGGWRGWELPHPPPTPHPSVPTASDDTVLASEFHNVTAKKQTMVVFSFHTPPVWPLPLCVFYISYITASTTRTEPVRGECVWIRLKVLDRVDDWLTGTVLLNTLTLVVL